MDGIFCVFTKIGKDEESLEPLTSDGRKNNNLSQIDIKGAVTLSVTIISFLMALSYLENIHSSTMSDFIPTVLLSTVSIVSLTLFIIIERKMSGKVKSAKKIPKSSSPSPSLFSSSSSMAATSPPLIDLNLLANKTILLNNISLMILGTTMFMVYQSIAVLIRSPIPAGFGGNAITAANVQIPFTLIILSVSVSAGFIISKFGNMKPSLIGTIVTTLGFFGLFLFHKSELLISANLAFIGIGLTLTRVGNWNILLENTPKDFTGISLGMTAMLFFVGMAIGPTIASIYMQSNQVSVKGLTDLFPSSQSYNMIFITALFISMVSIALMLALKKVMSNPERLGATSINVS